MATSYPTSITTTTIAIKHEQHLVHSIPTTRGIMESPKITSTASYWQYKEDTSYVLKWVGQTAQACGWKPQPIKQAKPLDSTVLTADARATNGSTSASANNYASISTGTNVPAAAGRLKGKARKAAKQKAMAEATAATEKQKRDEDERGLVHSAQDILRQANLISTHLSQSPPVVAPPPVSVIHALGRAIKMRQEFSDWFKLSRPGDHKSNTAHQYFVKVLEKIESLFVEAAEKAAAHSNQAATKETVARANRMAEQNIYESLLQLAVSSEDETLSAQPSPPVSGPATTEKTATSDGKHQMEVKGSQENAFMVFTLFMDLQKLKSEIKSLWQRCFEDGTDLIVAHLLTAQALDFVERSEKRVLDFLDIPGITSQVGRYEYCWSFPGTYCQLLTALRDPTDAKAVLEFEASNHATEEGGDAITMNDLIFTFSARRLFSAASPKLEDFVFANSLLRQFADDPLTLLNADLDKVLDRDRSLCSLLLAMVRLEIITSDADCDEWAPHAPAFIRQAFLAVRHDPIVQSLRRLQSTQEVNLTSVFAAEIMLDIKDVCSAFPGFTLSCGEISDHYIDLLGIELVGLLPRCTEESLFTRVLDLKGSVQEVMAAEIRVIALLPNTAEAAFREKKKARLEETAASCRDSIKVYADLGPLPLKYTEAEYQQSGLFDPILQPDLDHIVKYYPMFVTHREALLQAFIEFLALRVLNLNKFMVGAMAHLYNASRKLGIGDLRWPAMDRVIDRHKIALFAGEPPTTPISMLKSFTHRYWGPERDMSESDRKKILLRDVTWMQLSRASAALNQHWGTSGRIPFWYTLESNALAAEAKKVKKAATGKTTPATQPSFVESMPAMEAYLKEEVRAMGMHVDYLEIDRVSVAFQAVMVKHAREVFGRQPQRALPEDPEDKWTGFDFVWEAFGQEAHLVGPKAKCGGDPSKLPPQDCDYMQESINCLAGVLRDKGIGGSPNSGADAGGEAVNVPVALSRYRMRGPGDGPVKWIFLPNCTVCNRKHYMRI